MSNHLHMLIQAPDENLDKFMRFFLTESSRKIQLRSGSINHLFGQRYKWTLLGDTEACAYVYKYVMRNPVRAGLAQRVEDYPFSSLRPDCRLPLVDGIGPIWRKVPRDFDARLKWLNMPTRKESEELVRRATKRFDFHFSHSNSVQKELRQLKSDYGVE